MNDWTGYKKLLAVGTCLMAIPLAVAIGEVSWVLFWAMLLIAYAGAFALWKNDFPKGGNIFIGGYILGGIAASLYLHWYIWAGIVVMILLMGAYKTYDDMKSIEKNLYNKGKA